MRTTVKREEEAIGLHQTPDFRLPTRVAFHNHRLLSSQPAMSGSIDPRLQGVYDGNPHPHQQQAPHPHAAPAPPPHSIHGAGSPYFQHGVHEQPAADMVDPHLHRERNGGGDGHDDDDSETDPSPGHLDVVPHTRTSSGFIPEGTNHPADPKRPRACDPCRQLKVRCDRSDISETCRRCAKGTKACFTSPPTRKRTRKADDKYAHMVANLHFLTERVEQQGRLLEQHNIREHTFGLAGPPQQDHYAAPPSGYTHAQNTSPSFKRRKTVADDSIADDMAAIHRDLAENTGSVPAMALSNRDPYIEKVDRLVSPDQAEHLFNRYAKELFPAFPAVPLPADAEASSVRKSNPLLYLAIIIVAPYGTGETIVSAETQRQLAQLLKKTLGEITFAGGERSLEIIQVMQLAVLWYRVPEHYEKHSFTVWVGMACLYACELGLGRHGKNGGRGGPETRNNGTSLEARRALLVNYYLSISITMILRKPVFNSNWGREIPESLDVLEKSPQALPSDKILCKHVRLAQLWENVSNTLKLTDDDADVDVLDPDFQYSLKSFETDLDDLSKSIPESQNNVLRLSTHLTNVFIHEAAMQEGLPVHDKSATSAVPAMLEKCLEGIHGTLEAFVNHSVDDLLRLPVLFSVRAMYALVSLMRMGNRLSHHSDVVGTISHERLRLDYYLDKMAVSFEEILKRDPTCAAAKFHHVIGRFRMTRRKSQSVNAHHEEPSGQTPLHLLSSVAMGSNHPGLPQPQQPTMPRDANSAVQVQGYAFPTSYDSNALMQGYNMSGNGGGYNVQNDPVLNIVNVGFDLNQTNSTLLNQFFFQDAGYGRFHDPARVAATEAHHNMGAAALPMGPPNAMGPSHDMRPSNVMGPSNGMYPGFNQ